MRGERKEKKHWNICHPYYFIDFISDGVTMVFMDWLDRQSIIQDIQGYNAVSLSDTGICLGQSWSRQSMLFPVLLQFCCFEIYFFCTCRWWKNPWYTPIFLGAFLNIDQAALDNLYIYGGVWYRIGTDVFLDRLVKSHKQPCTHCIFVDNRQWEGRVQE